MDGRTLRRTFTLFQIPLAYTPSLAHSAPSLSRSHLRPPSLPKLSRLHEERNIQIQRTPHPRRSLRPCLAGPGGTRWSNATNPPISMWLSSRQLPPPVPMGARLTIFRTERNRFMFGGTNQLGSGWPGAMTRPPFG